MNTLEYTNEHAWNVKNDTQCKQDDCQKLDTKNIYEVLNLIRKIQDTSCTY